MVNLIFLCRKLIRIGLPISAWSTVVFFSFLLHKLLGIPLSEANTGPTVCEFLGATAGTIFGGVTTWISIMWDDEAWVYQRKCMTQDRAEKKALAEKKHMEYMYRSEPEAARLDYGNYDS